jgi:hypothetical protein
MSTAVWFILTEVKATPASSYPSDLSDRILVWCHVPEFNLNRALDMARIALEKDGYELRDVRHCYRLDLAEWDFDEFPIDSDAYVIAQGVVANNEVLLGPFIAAPGT